jgi:phenylpropionate dioxygenase-like ring-hydroxylating dioxygenase large terminal subunit
MSLEPRIFTDPAIAALERRRVFGRVPFIAAHGSEVPEPHSFLTKKLPLNEAVIVRQPDGSVRVFVNMCRHRGTMLEHDERGHCRVFSCQYHGWSYDLDGALRNITYQESFGSVDRSQLNLIELPAEERHGFIWVIDNPDATIDVAEWLGPETDAILASYGMDEMVCFRSGSFVEPVNWKIMHDAFLDGYHIKFAHPRSAGKYVHTNTYVVEDYGRHCRFASPRKSLDAWLEQDPTDDETMAEHVMLSHFVGPNVTLLQLQDNYQLLSFYPISDNPTESRMEMRLMVPPVQATDLDPDEWEVKWEKNWYILEKVLLGEDFPLLRSIQRAYASEVASPSILGRNEVLNQTFHREVARMRNAQTPEVGVTIAGRPAGAG